MLEQSLTLEPDDPRARFYIALSMEQAGRPNEARQAFEALAKQIAIPMRPGCRWSTSISP